MTSNAGTPKVTRVLVVEDNPPDAELVRLALEDVDGWSFETWHVKSLAEACTILGQRRFDAVISDLGLPDAHGLDAVAGIRRANGEIPLIVLTGASDVSIGVAAVSSGAQAFVVKGWEDPKTLAQRIVDAIGRGRVMGELSAAKSELSESSLRLDSIPKIRSR